MAEAKPFVGCSCGSKLSEKTSLDPLIEVYVSGKYSVSKSIHNLHSYLFYRNPILHPVDVKAIVDYIFTNNTLSYPEFEPSTMWQLLARRLKSNTKENNRELVTFDHLSLEAQVLIWILQNYSSGYQTIDEAFLVGKIHKFIIKDIKSLRPNQTDQYYRKSFGRLFL